jgi:hypothetical protein
MGRIQRETKLSESLKQSLETTDKSCVHYTLKDYRNIQRQQIKRLGGLGPVHIGTVDWQEKMKRKQRILDFSKQISLSTKGDRSLSVPKVKGPFY